MKQPLWTTEQTEELKKLAGTMSCAQIGIVINRSRNGVQNKIVHMGLPRFDIKTQEKAPAKPKREPMVALYKNHAAAARKAMPREVAPSRLEWCPTCSSPVSNWAEHSERLGCKRT